MGVQTHVALPINLRFRGTLVGALEDHAPAKGKVRKAGRGERRQTSTTDLFVPVSWPLRVRVLTTTRAV